MNLKFAIANSQRAYPQAWKVIKRKRFSGVDRWHHPDLVYLQQARMFDLRLHVDDRGDVVNHLGELVPTAEIGWQLISANQIAHDSPIFFVAPGLLEAAVMSSLPDHIDWENMPLPFQAASFILPKGGLYDSELGEVAHVDYCRVEIDDEQNPKLVFIISMCNPTGAGGISEWLMTDDPIPSGPEHMYAVVFNLLFAMAARPEYVESGRRFGVHKKSKSELWTPNIIGRKYATKRDPNAETGTHASPRMHWRRGHFRQQAFGIGRTEHKIIWIEPMLVNAKVVDASLSR